MKGSKKTILPYNEYGKVPPQAIDLEEAVLGAAMSYKGILPQIKINFNPEYFYKESHQKIAKAILDVYQNGLVPNDLAVINRLRYVDELELIGGAYYISILTGKAIPNNQPFNMLYIRQCWMYRELIRVSGEILKRGFNL